MMSLFTLFGGLKNVFKVKSLTSDTVVFRLHYRVTMGLLLGCSLLITAVQLVSDPITCDVKGVPSGMFSSFCWIHATFTLPYRQLKKDGPIIQPGVGPLKQNEKPQEEAKYHGFYQWVGMVLFLEAITFYIPHYLWKTCEGKKVERLVSGISSPLASEDTKKKHKIAIAEYFHCNKRRHIFYGIRFVFCELLNLTNVTLHMYLVDQLLGGEFSTYGIEVLKYAFLADEERVDPMVKIFPKVTKCTFHNFGSSGSIQRYDGLCVLPINMVNDKIFIALWFWFLTLFAITFAFMIFRFITMCSKGLRISILRASAPNLTRKVWSLLKIQLGFGDWLILQMMSHHLDIQIFSEILKEIKKVSDENSRSMSTTIFEVNCDTDVENGDEYEAKKSRKTSDVLGRDQQLIQDMIADGYDPSEMRAMMGWDKNYDVHGIGDGGMKADHDHDDRDDRDDDNNYDESGMHDDAMGEILEEMLWDDENNDDQNDDNKSND